MKRAKVEKFRTMKIGHMVTRERAILPCGCCVFVGRDAFGKVTTGAQPCRRPGHQGITDHFSGLLRLAQQHPTVGRPLVEVCRDLLSDAAREMGNDRG